MKHKRVYKVKYLAPTSTKGSRVKITNLNTSETKIEPYNYKYNNIQDIATYYIEEMYTYLKVTESFFDKDTLYLIATKPY